VHRHSSRCIAKTATNADLDAARAVLETNLFGVWPLIQAVLALLRRSSAPRIVIVGNGAGSHGDRDF
jgi:NAD(P)-dependent dehydrogenase (short-subunit alcohol dehydrogenase family)